jgi:DNA polymerase III sliding clamp (beta) subunit (PCNA family)
LKLHIHQKHQIHKKITFYYLKDVLSHIGTEDLRIELKSSISAGLFYPGKQEKNSDLTMLLMPIRLGD